MADAASSEDDEESDASGNEPSVHTMNTKTQPKASSILGEDDSDGDSSASRSSAQSEPSQQAATPANNRTTSHPLTSPSGSESGSDSGSDSGSASDSEASATPKAKAGDEQQLPPSQVSTRSSLSTKSAADKRSTSSFSDRAAQDAALQQAMAQASDDLPAIGSSTPKGKPEASSQVKSSQSYLAKTKGKPISEKKAVLPAAGTRKERLSLEELKNQRKSASSSQTPGASQGGKGRFGMFGGEMATKTAKRTEESSDDDSDDDDDDSDESESNESSDASDSGKKNRKKTQKKSATSSRYGNLAKSKSTFSCPRQ